MDESFVCPCLMLVTEIRLKTGNRFFSHSLQIVNLLIISDKSIVQTQNNQ